MGYCHVKHQCLVVRLPREIDHYQAEKVRKEMEMEFMRSLIRDIIFDFSETSFMDSSGIGLILGRVREMEIVSGRVFLFGGNHIISRMWEMSGILSHVIILNTIEEMKEVYE
ncbi:MAG: anti-sigma factor antagonist [Eubacterium sp.]|nr:anti-sigma factor antagonist [Eubacterium sp.]